MNPTSIVSIVAYLTLFATVGFLFVFAALLIGRFLRAQDPTPGKLEIYECGETPIGPGFVQFDLRFYVVALLFIIFEVEVAFFFPWAVVFGKTAQLRDPGHRVVVPATAGGAVLSDRSAEILQQLGVPSPGVPSPAAGVQINAQQIGRSARDLARMAMVDIAVFFGVLMVGFAYLWSKGDLNWVRASSSPSLGEVAHTSDEATAAGSQALAEIGQQDQQ